MIVDNKIVQNDPPQEKIKFILELFNSNKLIDAKREIDKHADLGRMFEEKFGHTAFWLNVKGRVGRATTYFSGPACSARYTD